MCGITVSEVAIVRVFWTVFWFVGLLYTVWVGFTKWESLTPTARTFIIGLSCGEAIFLFLAVHEKPDPRGVGGKK